MVMERRGVRFQKEEKEWKLAGLLYADDLVLYGESEQDLRAMVGRFAEVCRRRGLKVNAGKCKVMVLGRGEGLECVVLSRRDTFRYESGTDEAECSRKMANWMRAAGGFGSPVNARNLQLQCARVLHELFLVPVLTYDSEMMIYREKEMSRNRTLQMKNLKGLIGIKRMDKISNARKSQLCEVTKGGDEKIDESVS